MKISVFKKGFNYSQDGPGNRLVYHLQGCNLRCPWCANPEGIYADCEAKQYNIQELVQEAKRSSLMFFDGGGVTFTGGEATVQFEALEEILQELKKEGINTALETNGTDSRLKKLFGCIDFLIMDFKHYDSNIHMKFTTSGNETVMQNIAEAANTDRQLLVRIPLIKGFNAARKDADGFLSFFDTVDCNRFEFEFLKYHEYGKEKWRKCGVEYTMQDAFVDDETVDFFVKAFTQKGLTVVRT